MFPMKKAAAAGPSAYPSKKAGMPAKKKAAAATKKGGVAKTLGSQFMAEGASC
jgi:hypothetical protein